MRLRSLEIQGFKSFPDKTTLSFGGGITAVVGPNGSGKSNIADAVRWVLGEQSTKNLRGQRMEDVIFGGTQTRKAQGYASVQLVIDNADRALEFDMDEVSISRKLYRSGDSEYRLNGTLVRLKDIHELFMDTGLGRDGYSIIGQGRIAEIVSAKSNARREIFEEAAGIAKFRYRKEEAERRLSQAEENLLRLRDILTELEDRIGPLKEQSEKARAFLALSEEKKTLEVSLWLLGLSRIKEQMAGQEDALFQCKSRYEQFERDASVVEQRIAGAFARMQELAVEVEGRRGAIRENEDRMAKGEAEKAVMENDIRHNEISIQRLRQELESAGDGVEELRRQLADKGRELRDGAQALAVTAGKIEAAEQRLAEQKEQTARVETQLAELAVRRDSVAQTLEQARLERAAGESLLGESAQRLEALKSSSSGHEQIVRELGESIQECARQAGEEQAKIDGLANSLRGYSLKRDARADKLAGVEGKQKELMAQAEQKLQRAKLLEDLEKSMEGFAHSVKYILGEANKGALSGVHGAVSSLIRVPERYALAIETALGGAMQNVVVENEDTAKRAIRMLQSAKAGRATFLPLTSVRGKRADLSKAERLEGFVGNAAGLVECDGRYGAVLDFLLGRVCVAEDLDAGTRIAKAANYAFRIVTLDGQVINAGGSYTGGSTAKQSGVLGRRAEIEALRRQGGLLTEQGQALEESRKALAAELSALDAAVLGVESERQTAQEELVRLGFAREGLEKELRQAEHNRALAAQELEALAKRLAELQGNELTSAQLIEGMQAQLAAIEADIASAAARRDSLALGTENANAALADQRMAQLAAQKDQDLLEQESERLRLQIENAGEREAQVKDEITQLEHTNLQIRAQIDALEAEKSVLAEQVAQENETISQLLAQRTELEGQTTALRTQERDIASRREAVSRELAKLEERQTSLRADYDAIIAKLWDEYELTRSQAAEIAQTVEDRQKADRRLGELRGKIRALGTVNVAAIEEYAQVGERYEFLSAQVRDVEDSKNQLLSLISELAQEMRKLFSENFARISEHFSRIFVQLFGGGRAELVLTQEEDVLEAGVDIHVQPPGKVIKNLSLLSGGEQAFVAIAIYFAILKVRPAPFCLLDEIEAALDDVNVVKFASYLRQMSDKTQFIAITHRRGTMEEADVLYGVTMQDEGVSKLLELHVTEVEQRFGVGAAT